MVNIDDIKSDLFELVHLGMWLADVAHGDKPGTSSDLFYDLLDKDDPIAIECSLQAAEIMDEAALDIVMSLKPRNKV